jgi:hypothetical protein
MTHDELLEDIDKSEDFAGMTLATTSVYSALRAIVVLHRPYDIETSCYTCGEVGYPCKTIQAIKKELG